MSKILILSDFYFEDEHLADYRRNLCKGLNDAGHSVLVLLKGPFYFLRAIFLGQKADIIFVSNFPSVYRAALILSGFFKKKLIVKVVSDYAWEVAIKKGKTFFLIGDFQNSKKSGKIAGLYKLQTSLCKSASTVIVSSDFLVNIVSGWGIEKEKIRVIHDAIDFNVLEISKEEARKKIAIPGSLLVSVGPLVMRKGFRMLVKIMPQLTVINQFFRLVIVGDGPEYKTLKAMIKNMGLDKKVHLVKQKNQEELAWFLAASDIFVLNSGHESFPYHVIEAMAAGIPVVTTAVGANLELIRQGENGFMVRYNDEFNLVEAIKTVWQMPELRERFIEEGKKTARYFNPEKMVRETVKILTI